MHYLEGLNRRVAFDGCRPTTVRLLTSGALSTELTRVDVAMKLINRHLFTFNPTNSQVESSKGLLLKGKPGYKGMAGKIPRRLLPFVDMSEEKQQAETTQRPSGGHP